MTETVRIPIGERVTIYARGKKGIYCADFWHNDQHRRRSLKTPNLKVAKQRALLLEADLVQGDYKPALPSITLGDAVTSYVNYLRTEQRRDSTIAKYRSTLERFQEFALSRGVNKLARVDLVLIDEFRASRNEKLSAKTMFNDAATLKGFFRWAKQRGLIHENPTEQMRVKRPILEPRGGPSLEQINRLLAAADPEYRTPLMVLAFTGMRSGELQRLRPEDVDLEGGWVHIVSREDLPTKNGRSRKVPIHPRLRSALAALPKRAGTWLFTTPPNQKCRSGDRWIDRRRLNEHLARTLKQLGIVAGRKNGGFHLHSLRHSFETICVNAGIPQRVVDAWMGHHSDRSMASIYYKLTDDDSQQFIRKVPFGHGKPTANVGNH